MKPCLACKEDIHDDALKCPHCHQIQNQVSRFVYSPAGNALIYGIILFAIIWSAYSIYSSAKDYPLTESLVISETSLSMNSESNPAKVSCFAEVKNNSDIRWSDFSVEATFYNQQGNLIDAHYKSLDNSIFPFMSFTARVTGNPSAPINKYHSCSIKVTDAD